MRQANSFLTRCSESVLQFLYPDQCALCTQIGSGPVCGVCASEMKGLPVLTAPAGPELVFQASVFEYEGRASQAVKRLKYSRSTSLAPFMAAQVRTLAERAGVLDDWLFVPVPLHWARKCRRGFNQADLLCNGLPQAQVMRDLLVRCRSTVPQASLTASGRSRNLEGAFKATRKLAGERIIVVDDVLTTGQTGRECAKTLVSAGAIEVGLLTFCADL